MSTNPAFTARLLESGAAGYAGMAASLLAERSPETVGRYGADAVPRWKQQIQQWVTELATALEMEEPALFHSRMTWARKAFLARDVPGEDIRAGLEALREILGEHLPGEAADSVRSILDSGINSVSGDPEPFRPVLDPEHPRHKIALRYLEHLLGGNAREATDLIMAEVDDGLPVRDAYLEVIVPALQEVGRLWHEAKLTIAEEHFVTMSTKRVMTLLCERGQPAARVDRSVITAAVEGNVHDVGVRVIADFFEMEGWRAMCLGPDVPADEIVKASQFFNADVIVLSAMLCTQLNAMQSAVRGLKGITGREVRVLVGGQALGNTPDLWKKLGADGSAADVDEVLALAARLTGLPE